MLSFLLFPRLWAEVPGISNPCIFSHNPGFPLVTTLRTVSFSLFLILKDWLWVSKELIAAQNLGLMVDSGWSGSGGEG